MAVESNRWGIIYNPKAGSRKTKKRWVEIRDYMDSKNVAYDYVHSEGFGSVERLARTMANNGYRTIVVVGGDGAINDAVNGIMHSDVEDKRSIALAVIPNGVGNDFAKFWDLTPDDYKGAVDAIIHRRLRAIDVGVVTYTENNTPAARYFLNAVYIGLGVDIVTISGGTRRFWGIPFVSYIASLVLMAFKRKLYNLHLKLNDEHVKDYVMSVAIGSARGYGLTPNAVPYNGWLDVSVISRPELFDLLKGLWLLQKGRLLNHKNVKAYRTKHVRILRARNSEISLDGRNLQSSHFPFDVSIQQEAMTFVIPE